MQAAHPAFDVTCLGPVAADVVLWRVEGALRATAIVKAVFTLVVDQPMRLSESEPLFRADVNFGRHPARPVEYPAEVAPYLPQTDVLLNGHACTPAGTTMTSLTVRLGVFGHAPLMSKKIHVFGDESGRIPFDRVPLVYDRAYGGIGVEENPLGTGIAAGSKSPNLVHPEDPRRVACFGAIGRTWPTRKRLLAGVNRKTLEAPIAEFPPGFNYSYFQAAPSDQRVPHLQGNEWVVLEGMHPKFPVLRSRLPTARAVARVYGSDKPKDGESITFVADTLRIDADNLRCIVVWRGTFSPSANLSTMRLVAGVETEKQLLVWPSLEALARSRKPLDAEPLELSGDDVIPLDATITRSKRAQKQLVLDDETVALNPLAHNNSVKPLPFAGGYGTAGSTATPSAAHTPFATNAADRPRAAPLPVAAETVMVRPNQTNPPSRPISSRPVVTPPPVTPPAMVPSARPPSESRPLVAGKTRTYGTPALGTPALGTAAYVPPSSSSSAPSVERPPPTPIPSAAPVWRQEEPAAPKSAPVRTPPAKPTIPASFPKLQNDLYGRFRKR